MPGFSPEQQSIRGLIRRVAAERVAPRAMEIDTKAEYPQDMFDLLRELGLFPLPRESGNSEIPGPGGGLDPRFSRG
jgi:alkylation response protein AidB-like acyl-CoA dehydrogenase